MGDIIAVVNQKGGVGKTTTVINLAACLQEQNHRVLLIDLDPQGNATSGYGLEKNQLNYTVYDLFVEGKNIEEIIQPTSIEGLDLLPSNMDLAGAEIELVDHPNRETILAKELQRVKQKYDYILIDCPPTVNLLNLNALAAAASVLIPIQCEYYALEGLSQLMHTISLIQNKLNPSLSIEGILFTMYDGRTNLALQVVEEVKKHFPQHVFETKIARNVRLGEAPSHGVPVIVYSPRSKGALQYRKLALELIERKQTR